ncbi:antitoxin Phd [Gordonia sp. HY442]|uniref:antitoxin Phd n=1 Tax=Gordonia zhenghanii TaxID=2911516 RepID=UPI001F3584D4|nr:antitoxin Phd [Gordonia zhenghanii]MCF8604003.1 antitoxin Phd [Gordonia zhenghanii]
MPPLTVEFDAEEYRRLTASAECEQKTPEAYVHDAVIERLTEYRRRIEEAAYEGAEWSAELNRRLS